MKAGPYFSAAFTFQRALVSEFAYLALAPLLLESTVNGIVYIIPELSLELPCYWEILILSSFF